MKALEKECVIILMLGISVLAFGNNFCDLEKDSRWEAIKTLIETGNPYKKEEAIAALVGIGDEASVKEIERLTKDRTPAVVNWALRALGELKSVESIPLISEVFEMNRIREDGHGGGIQISAMDALGEIGSEKAVEILGRALSKVNMNLDSHIVAAMVKIGSESALPFLEEHKVFVEEQLAIAMDDENEFNPFRHIWEEAEKQVNEAIGKIKG